MKQILSQRSVYFFNDKRERVDIPRGESGLDDAYLENAQVKALIDEGVIQLKGEAPVVVDEAAEAKAEAGFWKACYEELAKLAPKQAAKLEAGPKDDGKGAEE